MYWIYIVVGVVVLLLLLSLRTVRPIDRGLVERFGRYARFAPPGLHFIIPFGIEKLIRVNITEMMVDAGGQEIITRDSLNAQVDAQVYFKVKQDEESVKASVYNVYNYKVQIVALARTTLRNIIGTMNLMEANSERGKINKSLYDQLTVETKNWGIEIVRTELKEINPPEGVQEAMNNVVIANNQKIAAVDFATATETKADGEKRAKIKYAEGDRQTLILNAEGEAQAIKLVNEAANKYFIGNAQTLRKLEAVEKSLTSNSKVVLPTGQSLVNVVGDLAGVTGERKNKE
ncbi:MAG: SPFH/Band 7/PHB domain protein [Dehalococcoidales bacterium]|nr:SPFH/Band 7/PHB domain protein [Dehalococcoidales bacterium]